MIEHETRLRVGRGLAHSEREASRQALTRVRSHRSDAPPPALTSDSGGGQRLALLEVYGKPAVWQGQGPHPIRPLPGSDWQYLQIVKHRRQRRLTHISQRVVYANTDHTQPSPATHTAYVERTHLTSRLMNARLTRRSLAFSKSLPMLRAACAWEDLVYNFARPLKSLRLPLLAGPRRWLPRSPALAAGLSDHICSVLELLSLVPVFTNYS